MRSRLAAIKNPVRGETRSDFPTFSAWSQSTPLVLVCVDISWFAMPTPIIEPTMVCELDAGRPRYQVPMFQMIAAMSSAKTIAKPARLPTRRISSTGRSEMTANATAPVETRTPMKFHIPDQTTATWGSIECVYITVATALAVSWNPFTNSNPTAVRSAMLRKRYVQIEVVLTEPRAFARALIEEITPPINADPKTITPIFPGFRDSFCSRAGDATVVIRSLLQLPSLLVECECLFFRSIRKGRKT